VPAVGDELEAVHQLVSPAKYFAAWRRDVPLGGQPSAPRAIAEAVVGGVTLDAPDALILGDHHGGYAWPAAPDP
jgi:hypothetical protein